MANKKKYLRSVNQVAKRSKKPAKKSSSKKPASCPANGAKTYLNYKGKAFECCGKSGHVACHIFDVNAAHESAIRLQMRMKKAAEKAAAAAAQAAKEAEQQEWANSAHLSGYGRRSRRRRSRR